MTGPACSQRPLCSVALTYLVSAHRNCCETHLGKVAHFRWLWRYELSVVVLNIARMSEHDMAVSSSSPR
jgi:hypothetical protein